ncbi:MAG: hypothetical protein ACRD52_07000, partial [Candidatus Acidiferrales bacterium]
MTLAEGLAGLSKAHPEDGVEVTVAAQTAAAGADDSQFPFAIVHRPGLRGLAHWERSCRSSRGASAFASRAGRAASQTVLRTLFSPVGFRRCHD